MSFGKFALAIGLLISIPGGAAQSTAKTNGYGVSAATMDYSNMPKFEINAWTDEAVFKTQLKEWTKANRKVASGETFSESSLPAGFAEFRKSVLAASTGDAFEQLLNDSYAKYNTHSDGMKFFLAQLHAAIPLRGIVWRMRPLFEEGPGFFGTRGSHVAAVQFVRTVVTGMNSILPTLQTKAAVEFLTQPSKAMSTDDQFRSMAKFQEFLVNVFAVKMKESVERIKAVIDANPTKIYVWDNMVFFGRGKFQDGINRYIGMGPAEQYAATSYMWRAIHDALVFSAYNQDDLIMVAGKLGSHMGIDSVLAKKNEDFGLTDLERSNVIRDSVRSRNFLSLRGHTNGEKTPCYGHDQMAKAYIALKNSVTGFKRSYDLLLEKKGVQNSMVLNPLLFQPDSVPMLGIGVANMVAVVEKRTSVLDKVSGESVQVDLPNYYRNPPLSLSALMATKFETNTPMETSIAGRDGKPMKYRIYTHGRSTEWNNVEWAKYVPSASGKPDTYMAEAKRIIHFSLGTAAVFTIPDLFVH